MYRIKVETNSGCGKKIAAVIEDLNKHSYKISESESLQLGVLTEESRGDRVEIDVVINESWAVTKEAYIAVKTAEKKIQQLLN